MFTLSNKSAIISLIATFFIGLIIIIIPGNWFQYIFGKDFTPVKHIIILLFPGILFIAFSNIYGHFLSATGQMAPLVVKSALGLIATITLALLLIPKFGLTGACITTVTSHLISSGYICLAFFTKNKYSKNQLELFPNIRENKILIN
jgi:O-antigen/teichoic acid export membrane protein